MWLSSTAGLLALLSVACSEPASEPAQSTVPIPITSATTSSTTVAETITSPEAASTTAADLFQVLVFHKTTGFRHDSISAGIEAITRLGEEHGFTVTAGDDASVFTEPGLAQYEVVIFLNTTGDILDPDQEQAVEAFIQDGHGFVGVHSATDTEYEWPWYGGLVGAYFDSHPAPQPATVQVVQPDHAVMQGLPASFDSVDEWYNFRSLPGPEVNVLARLDETSYEGGSMGENHPIVWAHEYDGGRSFYTGFGHTVEAFSEPLVLAHLGNGILWTTGRDRSGPESG